MGAAANRYARALLDVLYPARAEAGLQQLRRLRILLDEQPDARLILENPTIPGDRRKEFLQEIAAALGFDRPIASFTKILVDHNRLGHLREILEAYQKALDERLGIVHALVTAARPLSPVEETEIVSRLEQMTGKQVRVDVAVDPSLIAGVVAQVGSTVYDGSVRQQLQTFKNRLSSS